MSERTSVGTGPSAAADSLSERHFGRALTAAIRSASADRGKVSAIARRSGVSPSSLYAYLAGSTLPSVETLDAICGTLGLPVSRQRELATLRDQLEDSRRSRRVVQAQRVTVSGSGSTRSGSSQLGAAQPGAAQSGASGTGSARSGSVRTGSAGSGQSVPDELLSDPGVLFGREAAFAQLDSAAAQSDGRPAMLALTGPAGVGKTACALAWAHRHRSDFPDGALYVDLAGYSPGEPRDARDVLGRLLGSLGVGDAEIPGRTEDRAGRLRSLLAGRRMVVVLDNAVDAEHVRPLLPGSAGPFVIVTSRDSLVGLAIDPGVAQAALSPLAEDAALQLLRASAPGLAGADDELQLLARRCGGLPLALRIIGAQSAQQTDTTVATVIEELSDGLDAFELDSGGASIREVLSWSRRRLSAASVRALALLGALPTTVFTLGAAAAVLGREEPIARAELRRLARCHLLEPAGERGYQLHDLIHEYATELGRELLGDDPLEAAYQRLVDWLVVEGERASSTLFHDASDENSSETAGADTASIRRAQLWFENQVDLIVAMSALTVRLHRPSDTVRVVRVIRRLAVEGSWRPLEALRLLGCALDATRAVADRESEAMALRAIGWIQQRVGDHVAADEALDSALAVYSEIGDEVGEAIVLGSQAAIHLKAGRLPEAVRVYERALELADRQHHVKAVAVMQNNLALCAMKQGDGEKALRHAREALVGHRSMGNGHVVARTQVQLAEIALSIDDLTTAEQEVATALNWARTIRSVSIEVESLNVLGELRARQGQWAAARRSFRDALAGGTDLQDPFEQARALEGLGRCDRQDGDRAGATTSWNSAVFLFTEMGYDDDEARVRALLGELGVAALGDGAPPDVTPLRPT